MYFYFEISNNNVCLSSTLHVYTVSMVREQAGKIFGKQGKQKLETLVKNEKSYSQYVRIRSASRQSGRRVQTSQLTFENSKIIFLRGICRRAIFSRTKFSLIIR